MVTITKNGDRLTVPAGAYREIFKSQGWKLEGESEKPKNESKSSQEDEKEKITPDEESTEIEDADEPEGEDFDEETDEDDLSEIPLSEMSVPQLREYATQLGVNIKGLTNAKALRSAIKSAAK